MRVMTRAVYSICSFAVSSIIAAHGAAQQSAQSASPAAPAASAGYLGVQVTMLTPELREFFGAAKDAGILVSKVEPDSPAFRDGLEVGDVIEEADGEKVVSVWLLERVVNQKKARDVLIVRVLRSRKPKVIKVTMEERRRSRIDLGQVFYFQWHGGRMELDRIDPQTFATAAERFREYFNEPMIFTRMQEMQRLLERERMLKLRIKRLEDRILHLEVQLKD